MPRALNTKLVFFIDCPGGGQVWIDGTTLFVAHMSPPAGTSIYDVSDPSKPRQASRVAATAGWYSNKVRARHGLMIVNHEKQGQGGDPSFGGGPGDDERQ